MIKEKSDKFNKKEIFVNTRLLLTGNQNGPSVKDLFNFFGIKNLINKANAS
jgi:hypothetical protein